MTDQRLRAYRTDARELLRLLEGGQAAAVELNLGAPRVTSILGVRIDYDAAELVADVFEGDRMEHAANGWRILVAAVDTVADFGSAAPRGRLVVRFGDRRIPTPEAAARLANAYVFTEPLYLDQPAEAGEDAPHADTRPRQEPAPDDRRRSRRPRRGQGGGGRG